MGGIGGPEKFIVNGKRLDGRRPDELRPVEIKAGVVPRADGSAMLTMGMTKIIVSVFGPRECIPKHMTQSDRGVLECTYSMASFSTSDRAKPGPSRRSTEISRLITDALTPAIFLERYPRTKIDVYIEVLNANAGTRTAAISAAAVALADAGIEMRDLVASVASGKVGDELVLDLFEIEDNFGSADVPLAIMPNSEKITLLQMDGELTKEEMKKLIQMNINACKEINRLQIKALKDEYKGTESPEEAQTEISEGAEQ